jgi:hypothetical protein
MKLIWRLRIAGLSYINARLIPKWREKHEEEHIIVDTTYMVGGRIRHLSSSHGGLSHLQQHRNTFKYGHQPLCTCSFLGATIHLSSKMFFALNNIESSEKYGRSL